MIEDVLHLKENSVKQSYLFLVDSKDRDHAAYPTPSEYTIPFTVPFKNVVGMEVVEASIPRTMYNIDVFNNQITFLIHNGLGDPGNSNLYVTATVEPGDYTIQTLLPALKRTLQMHINNNPSLPIATIVPEAVSNPPEVKSLLRFRCPYAFSMDMARSSIAETLGFDLHVDPREAEAPIASRRWQPVDGAARMYHSVDNVGVSDGSATYTAFEGPRSVLQRATGIIAQRFTVASDTYLYQLWIAVSGDPSAMSGGAVVPWVLRQGSSSADGSVVAAGMVPVSSVDGSLSDSAPMQGVKLYAGTEYWLVMSPASDAGMGVYYNDVVPTGASLNSMLVNGVALDTDNIVYQASIKILVQDEYHALTAPGIYSLVGERYVVLRCPEIEENAFRSLAYCAHSLGLAKFRLGVVGYSENPMEFSKVPLREFHPIGKLSRLSLRFETGSGRLYDFKGVNHTITFAIYYYEPKNTAVFAPQINPNYKTNYLEYMYSQEEQEEDSDDALEDEDYSRDRLEEYRTQEATYHPDNIRRLDVDALLELRKLQDLDIRRGMAEAEAEYESD